ncbi:MAG: NAD(+)/NADH kinase [Acidobacteriota bacterium]
MVKRLAIFGGSFNPPAIHHRIIAEALIDHFDEIVVVPCGPRPDKSTTNDVEPIHRATMVDLTFRGLAKVRVELFDLELSTFTYTYKLDERFHPEGEIWHVITVDLIKGGKLGQSTIQRSWERGEDIWQNLNFAIIVQHDYDYDPADLPLKHKIFKVDQAGASSIIREKIFKRESIEGLVLPEVANYIKRYGLYRVTLLTRAAKFNLKEPRLLIDLDERNPESKELAKSFQHLASDNPNCILVIGGDGTMLHSIRKYWRLRLPFLGINTGHRGFLLNGIDELTEGELPNADLILRHSPLLYLETCNESNSDWHCAYAFTDAWVERARSQTAWIEVKINGDVRIPKLISDGVLVATAAGSTAYARSMGATPLLVETPAVILVGSNVMEPPNWKSVLLSLDTHIEFTALNYEKRPLNGYADGEFLGMVTQMRVRISRIAAVELAFSPRHDMAQKISELQFPKYTSIVDTKEFKP